LREDLYLTLGQAISSKEDYKTRCKKAEESARDAAADLEAIKSSLEKKVHPEIQSTGWAALLISVAGFCFHRLRR
jgi:hypothetical protein